MSSILGALRAYDVKFADPGFPDSSLVGEFVFKGAIEQNTAGGENSLIAVSSAVADPAIRGELLGSVTGTAADQKLVLIADGLEIYTESQAQTEAVHGAMFRATYLRYKRGDRDRYYWCGRHMDVLTKTITTASTVTYASGFNHAVDVELQRPIVADLSGVDTLALGTSVALGAATADIVCSVIFHGAIMTEAAGREFLGWYSQNRSKLTVDLSDEGNREKFRGLRARRRRFLPGGR